MDVSIIIPTRSRLAHLQACLRGLVEQDYDARQPDDLGHVEAAEGRPVDDAVAWLRGGAACL